MPIQAAGPFGISIGTVSGETLRRPPVSSRSSWSSRVTAPPMPVATTTARRSGSTCMLSRSPRPAWVHASLAATSATCSHRSSLRAWTRGSTSVGATASGAAIFTGSWWRSTHSWSASSMRRTPDRPASSASHVDATSPPSGGVAPSPGTTTSGAVLMLPPQERPRTGGASLVLRDVVHRVADRLQLGQLVVGDLHPELVLGLHRDLDHRQRVDVEVVDEGLLDGHLGGVDTCDLLDDLGEAAEDLGVVSHGGSPSGGNWSRRIGGQGQTTTWPA